MNNKRFMLAFLFFIVGIYSCKVPQTRAEFVSMIKEGGTLARVESKTVKKSFSEVYNRLKSRANKCFNIQVVSTVRQGYSTSSSTSIYKSTSKRLSGSKGEITVRVNFIPKPLGNMPKGGMYKYAIDIKKLSGSKTKVTIYGPSMGSDDFFAAVTKWSKGKTVGCPKLN